MNIVDNVSGTEGPVTPRPNCDWYSVVRPVTCFARIIGIFPFSSRGPVGGRKYYTDWTSLIYSSGVLILWITSFIMLQPPDESDVLERTSMGRIITQFFTTTNVLLTVVVFVTVIIAQEKMTNTMNDMYAQDDALRKLGIQLDYAADFKQSRIRVGIIAPTIVMLLICDFVSVLEYNLRFPLYWMAWAFTRFVRVTSTCFFAEMILILKRKFTAINGNLTKMIEETRNSPLQSSSMQIGICKGIRSIAIIHGDLCQTASSLNQIFGAQIVIGIIYALVTLTSDSYYIVQEIRNPNGKISVIAGCLTWALLGSVDILYILWTCIVTRNQANLTGKLIHKLNLRDVDPAIDLTIQSFSLQLHHAKIEFTGADLFPFDATLIRSIIGAVTTYLVIALQFDTAEP